MRVEISEVLRGLIVRLYNDRQSLNCLDSYADSLLYKSHQDGVLRETEGIDLRQEALALICSGIKEVPEETREALFMVCKKKIADLACEKIRRKHHISLDDETEPAIDPANDIHSAIDLKNCVEFIKSDKKLYDERLKKIIELIEAGYNFTQAVELLHIPYNEGDYIRRKLRKALRLKFPGMEL